MLCCWASCSKHFEATLALQNVMNYTPNNTASHPRQLEPSTAPLWEPKLSQILTTVLGVPQVTLQKE
jgi:hypothetical protein